MYGLDNAGLRRGYSTTGYAGLRRGYSTTGYAGLRRGYSTTGTPGFAADRPAAYRPE